jgi:protein-tyrosine kinase
MSRIHEALKKAEQERAANAAAMPQPSLITPADDSLSAAASSPVTPAFGAQLSLDTLLTRIPQMAWRPEAEVRIFMNGDDSARGTEQFRTLRSRLYHLREKMTLKSVLVTSALPREGKSFTSANLAQVLARQQGRRVLLIDADLRGPQLHEMLGTAAWPGLSDYLQGKDNELAIMQRGPLENLFFIPSGTGIQDPAGLVSNGRLKMLLERVEPLFDWIILDSPPAIPVSDASVLAKACDGVLLVVRSNSTPSDLARKARQEFPDESLVGVVLNGAGDESAAYAGYYDKTRQKGPGPRK